MEKATITVDGKEISLSQIAELTGLKLEDIQRAKEAGYLEGLVREIIKLKERVVPIEATPKEKSSFDKTLDGLMKVPPPRKNRG